MERLTKRVGCGEAVPVEEGNICAPFERAGLCKTGSQGGLFGGWERHCNDTCALGKMIDKLADYEDSGMEPAEVANLRKIIEEKRFLELPCAIGTKVYMISWCDEMVDGERCPYDCGSTQRALVFNTDCIKYCGIDECKFNLHMLDWVGDTVFLTREEAMKKLEEKAYGKTNNQN